MRDDPLKHVSCCGLLMVLSSGWCVLVAIVSAPIEKCRAHYSAGHLCFIETHLEWEHSVTLAMLTYVWLVQVV